MTFMYPAFFWLFIPLILLFFIQKKRTLTDTVHIIVLGLILISLSRPVIEKGLQEGVIKSRDIIIALDVSYSMKASDIAPNRYDFAKKTINAFLEENPKDNIMLIAFTSNPLLLSPPTTDHLLIKTALKSLNPEYILTKGTSLKKLFAKLAKLKHSEKNLILITDGGEEDDLSALAEQIQDAQIKLTVLALGTKQGTTIENPDGTMLKDKKGDLVVSRINPLLEKLARRVNGVYITPAASSESTAKALQDALNAQEQISKTISKKQQLHSELYQFSLLLALLLFFMVHTRAARYLLPLFVFIGVQAEASVLDGYMLHAAYSAYGKNDFAQAGKYLKTIDRPSLQSRFAEGNTYYKLGNYKKAIAVYRSIRSTSAKTKQKLYYNTGNAYAMLGQYDKAKIYYTKALQLGEDEESLCNLRVVALLQNKADAQLGIAHPKSQNSDSSKSESQENENEKSQSRDEDQPSSGSGSGGESKKEKRSDKEKQRLILEKNEEEQPLSSKVYELINKGYIRETQPW